MPKEEAPGFCRRLLGRLLGLLLLAMLIAGVVALGMELSDKDPGWRKAAHSVPGVAAFRARLYEPARSAYLAFVKAALGP